MPESNKEFRYSPFMFRLYHIFKYSPSKFTVLLGFLVVQIFISPIAGDSLFLQQVLYFYTYLVLLSAVSAIMVNRVKLYAYFVLYGISLVSSIMFFRTRAMGWLAGSECADMLMLLIAIWGIQRFMWRQKRVTRDLISGAICIYMLAGLVWSDAYSLCEIFKDGSFSGIDLSDNVFAIRGALTYFSYVTMLTVGYGDILPVSFMARSLAILQGLFGQMYLAVFIAGILGAFLSQKSLDGAGNGKEENADSG
ncbi:potassium channel family protein [Desulfovibrio sp. JC010]|uniref:potassium channel family protein n=1 Tax=Desulfovibrio sp. JC010 TaxID=2593641 RepID=UPI0013D00469|nr:potassium channel family protein [Desulfovibrio sp. JC010]NDV25298.1 two pore domain potassium channel family protein [Desulfovibrio sp. JC010]